MNNRLTASKTSQCCQQAVKVNKTNTDPGTPFPILSPFLSRILLLVETPVLLPIYKWENTLVNKAYYLRHVKFCFPLRFTAEGPSQQQQSILGEKRQTSRMTG